MTLKLSNHQEKIRNSLVKILGGAPENRLDAEFVRLVNEDYEIMTENFTKRLVDRRHIGFAPRTVAKPPLNHAERGFDIRPLVKERTKHRLFAKSFESPPVACHAVLASP